MTPLDAALDLHRQGKLAEAEAAYRAILAAAPQDFRALHMLGVLAGQIGRGVDAERLMAAAVAANPRYVEGHCDRGAALMALKRPAAALTSFDAALAVDPLFLAARVNKGAALMDLERPAEALLCFDAALTMRADLAILWSNQGNARAKLGRWQEALQSYDRALALDAALASAVDGRAKALRYLGRDGEALAAFRILARLAPKYPEALGNLFGMQQRCADWDGYAEISARLVAEIRAGAPAQSPRAFLLHAPAPEDQMQCARLYAAGRLTAPAPWTAPPVAGERIKVAYVSADFRDHIVGELMADLIPRHDRARFEIIGVSLGAADASTTRRALEQACDHFLDVRALGDAEAARAVQGLGADVAVDLTGYTEGARAGLFAHRLAPVQAGYLGYPGTLGAPLLDYIIGDAHVIPPEHEPFYAEKVARLPDTFFPAHRPANAAATPARAACGLPETGFVFACFNQVNKINPPMFDIWMRLLRETPGAVLWLRNDKDVVAYNLRAAAQARGVDPARIVFAGRASLDQHLARHALADLFLDTWPYCAHGTAAHALGAGLPVLTWAMGGFASRVSESLLRAAGLSELVTRSAADYAALALDLAAHPEKIAALKAKLAAAPLFDLDRRARALERAYAMMVGRSRAGEAPTTFSLD